jgi:3-dehydroquinate dehydratase-2
MDKQRCVHVWHGPNLQALGTRQPETYGSTTEQAIIDRLRLLAKPLGWDVVFLQSNHEGVLLDAIDRARGDGIDAAIINPGAWTHYSLALRDALAMLSCPIVEVHISNVYAREPFRQQSVTAPIAWGVITGLGVLGYELALHAVHARINGQRQGGGVSG